MTFYLRRRLKAMKWSGVWVIDVLRSMIDTKHVSGARRVGGLRLGEGGREVGRRLELGTSSAWRVAEGGWHGTYGCDSLLVFINMSDIMNIKHTVTCWWYRLPKAVHIAAVVPLSTMAMSRLTACSSDQTLLGLSRGCWLRCRKEGGWLLTSPGLAPLSRRYNVPEDSLRQWPGQTEQTANSSLASHRMFAQETASSTEAVAQPGLEQESESWRPSPASRPRCQQHQWIFTNWTR